MPTSPQQLARQTIALVLAGGRGTRLHSLTDRRARIIHRLGAQIILRELAFVDDPALRARVLLEHGTASRVDPRLGMLVQALALSPMQTLRRAPVIARHLAAHAKRLLQARGD